MVLFNRRLGKLRDHFLPKILVRIQMQYLDNVAIHYDTDSIECKRNISVGIVWLETTSIQNSEIIHNLIMLTNILFSNQNMSRKIKILYSFTTFKCSQTKKSSPQGQT